MKKVWTCILIVSLMLCAALPAFAANINALGGTDSAQVKGTYVAGESSATVYSVDISWGALQYTYTDSSEGTWNPATHTFDNVQSAAWTATPTGGDTISVTNHSNAAMKSSFSYTPATGYTGISGSFDKNTFNLATAVGTAVQAAPTDSAKLSLSGALGSTVTTATTIGTVTITISAQ